MYYYHNLRSSLIYSYFYICLSDYSQFLTFFLNLLKIFPWSKTLIVKGAQWFDYKRSLMAREWLAINRQLQCKIHLYKRLMIGRRYWCRVWSTWISFFLPNLSLNICVIGEQRCVRERANTKSLNLKRLWVNRLTSSISQY